MQWLRKLYRDSSIAEISFAVIVLLAAAVIAFSLVIGMLHVSGLLSEAVAAWVGALGTIGAIAGSFAVGRRQAISSLMQAQMLARDERDQRLRSCDAIVEHLLVQMDVVLGFTEEGNPQGCRLIWEERLESHMTTALRVFDALPVHELGGAQRVTHAVMIRDTFQQVADYFRRWYESNPVDAGKEFNFLQCYVKVHRAVARNHKRGFDGIPMK
jgi:hypothetical protein